MVTPDHQATGCRLQEGWKLSPQVIACRKWRPKAGTCRQAADGSVLQAGAPGLPSGEVVLCGEAGCGGAGAYAYLAVDGVEVSVYGVGAYEVLLGYAGVGES